MGQPVVMPGAQYPIAHALAVYGCWKLPTWMPTTDPVSWQLHFDCSGQNRTFQNPEDVFQSMNQYWIPDGDEYEILQG